jgi:hypothetical protein
MRGHHVYKVLGQPYKNKNHFDFELPPCSEYIVFWGAGGVIPRPLIFTWCGRKVTASVV